MKKIKLLELIGSMSLMASKYFLAISSIWGWNLSIFGYILISILSLKIKLRIAALITATSALLSIYGLYKWTNNVDGLQAIDYTIIGLSIIFSIFLVIFEARKKRELWFVQTLTSIFCIIAFITLGMKMQVGWWALFLVHSINIYLYGKKKAYIVVGIQIVSMIIALVKIYKYLV